MIKKKSLLVLLIGVAMFFSANAMAGVVIHEWDKCPLETYIPKLAQSDGVCEKQIIRNPRAPKPDRGSDPVLFQYMDKISYTLCQEGKTVARREYNWQEKKFTPSLSVWNGYPQGYLVPKKECNGVGWYPVVGYHLGDSKPNSVNYPDVWNYVVTIPSPVDQPCPCEGDDCWSVGRRKFDRSEMVWEDEKDSGGGSGCFINTAIFTLLLKK